jgi:hypothetical protein
MELENLILCDVNKVHKVKGHKFLSYAEYRPNTNISNIMKNMSHQGEITNGRWKEKEEVKKVNIVDIPSI